MKISFSCTENFNRIITKHNNKIIRNKSKENTSIKKYSCLRIDKNINPISIANYGTAQKAKTVSFKKA